MSVKHQSEKLIMLDQPNHCWHYENHSSCRASFNAQTSSQKSVHIIVLLADNIPSVVSARRTIYAEGCFMN